MATYTTNLNLKKPAQSDKIRIADINNNMDDIDAAFGAVGNDSVATQLGDIQGAIAIVATGNAHAAITAGQFVYVKDHDTLDTGLYVATSNISQNGTLSSSNLTADTAGGLNALSDQIGTLDSKKPSKDAVQLTNGTAVTYTFQDNTPFILLIERANSTGVGYSGLYIGYAHSNSHVVPVQGTTECTVSISGRTLTLTASATNMEARIITFSY